MRLPALALIALAACSPSVAEEPVAATEPLSFTAERVELDHRSGEMLVSGVLIRSPKTPKPERVWLWPYFTNPAFDPAGSWSDQPMAVDSPFATSDTARVQVRGPFHWHNLSGLPRDGFYARVNLSTDSAAARLPTAERTYSTDGALPVQVRG